jgi:hypothetical protein
VPSPLLKHLSWSFKTSPNQGTNKGKRVERTEENKESRRGYSPHTWKHVAKKYVSTTGQSERTEKNKIRTKERGVRVWKETEINESSTN